MSSTDRELMSKFDVTDCYHPYIDGKDFSCLESITRDTKIIFMAESRHYVAEFKDAFFDIAVYLHQHANVRVVALESLYGLHPFLEDASLGKIPISSEVPFEPFVEKIAEYNKDLAQKNKLLVTTIDIEHSINHTKDVTVRYLSHLADYATLSTASQELKKVINKLHDLKERGEIHSYLNNLEEHWERNKEHFADDVIEEIRFSLELMHASIDYQLLPREDTIEFEEIRGKYFRATIQRALAKAEERNGILLCYVGATHAVKTPKPANEHWCGQWTEACYFAQEYPPTAGKTASILLCAAAYKNQSDYSEDIGPLERVCLDSAPQSKVSFLNLSRLDMSTVGVTDTRYVSQYGTKFDGIVFLRDVASKSKSSGCSD